MPHKHDQFPLTVHFPLRFRQVFLLYYPAFRGTDAHLDLAVLMLKWVSCIVLLNGSLIADVSGDSANAKHGGVQRQPQRQRQGHAL